MGIERKEPVRMIKDYNESIAFQPVRIDDRPWHHRMDGAPLDRLDLNTSTLHIGIENRMFLAPEEGNDFPVGLPGQAPPSLPAGQAPDGRTDRGCAAARLQFM